MAAQGRITLLFDIEVSGPSSVRFSVHRAKGFKIPDDEQMKALIMELELTAVMMGYVDIVNFWKKQNMLNYEAAQKMMARFCMTSLTQPQNEIIENIPENMAQQLQSRDSDSIMKILKG
jgi:hypothetical protein